MRYRVFVRLKPGVLDVQGKTVEKGLTNLGFEGIENVRVGKLIELDVEQDDPEKAKEQVEALCEKLLANTVIENYEVQSCS